MYSTRDRNEYGTVFGGVVTWVRKADYGRTYGTANCSACGGHDDHITYGDANDHARTCRAIPPASELPAEPPASGPCASTFRGRVTQALRRSDV